MRPYGYGGMAFLIGTGDVRCVGVVTPEGQPPSQGGHG
jgi:hypothetical protein